MADTTSTPAEEKPATPRKTRKPRTTAAAKEAADTTADAPKPKKATTRTRTARAKKAPEAAPAAEAVPVLVSTPAPAAPPAAEIEIQPEPGPAPEPAPGFATPETVGGHEPQGKNNRKRRRRNRRGGDAAQQPMPARHAAHVDPDELKRRAWKIYLGEVTEEGLALMDDRTASEAARRAFRVAELFLIESAHHRPAPPAPAEPAAHDAPAPQG